MTPAKIVARLREDAACHLAASRSALMAPDVAAGHRYTGAALQELADEIEREAKGGA